MSLFELSDAFTILSVLTLEAAGFAERGVGWKLADQIGLEGSLPISTFGGLKSRGNPVGATGVYQALEARLAASRRGGRESGRRGADRLDSERRRIGQHRDHARFASLNMTMNHPSGAHQPVRPFLFRLLRSSGLPRRKTTILERL